MENMESIFGVISFFVVVICVIVIYARDKRHKSNTIPIIITIIAGVILLSCVKITQSKEQALADSTPTKITEPIETESDVTETVIQELTWKDNIESSLADEIASAFTEIGENPDNITSVEYVDVHTSGKVFERKCYKVEFSHDTLFDPGWEHSRYYRIETQNYYDGEPEKAEYPNEFLVTIKFWAGDDGHSTNINQWTWTGIGQMQEGGRDNEYR